MNFNTALHYACMLDYKEIIEILLKKATLIDIQLRNCDDKTAKELIIN